MKTGYFSRAEPTIFLIALLELLHRPSGSKTYIGLRTPTRVLKNKQTNKQCTLRWKKYFSG